MKITDTKIGQSVVTLGQQIEQAAKVENKSPAQVASQAQDVHAGIGKLDVDALALELKAKLDEVRGMLGSTAVESLMAALPEAALAALQKVQPNLPLEPGESALVVYKEKLAQLMALEMKVQAAQDIIYSGIKKWAWGPQDSHKGAHLKEEEGRILEYLHDGHSLQNVRNAQNASTMWQYYTDKAPEEVAGYNKRLQEAFPGIPEDYLLKDPTGGGAPGKLHIRDFFKMIYGGHGGYGGPTKLASGACSDLETLRSLWAGYPELQKEVVALRNHIKSAGFPTPEDIAVLKAEALDKDTSLKDLHREATALIAEIESFTISSRTKREILEEQGESTTKTKGSHSSVSRTSQRGTPQSQTFVSGTSESTSTTKHHSTSEVLNLEAREYVVLVSPELNRLKLKDLEKYNHVSPTESHLMMERLLTIRRLYEAMLVREPDSEHTLALKGWMEESKFTFKTQEAKSDWQIGYPEIGTLRMPTLRQDLLGFADKGRYDKDRVPILKDEIALGVAKPKSSLSIKSLSSI